MRTSDLTSKFKRIVYRKNPASHRHAQKETTLALSTINEVIHKNLSKDNRKIEFHCLTDWHKKNRKTKYPKQYAKHPAGDKSA